MTRRDFVGSMVGLTGFAAAYFMNHLSSWASPFTSRPRGPRGKGLRIAHLTDIHIEPGTSSAKGFEACLEHVQSLKNPPALILNGGDAVMDAFKANGQRVHDQWEVWKNVLGKRCKLPLWHCLGNHDVWNGETQEPGSKLLHGKRLAMEVLGLESRYYSFDQEGWHFIVLDSTSLVDDSYQAKLDNKQFAWLQADLQGVPVDRPVVIVSHIPILSACVFFDGENETGQNWLVPGQWMHLDARRFKDLFAKHRNVRLCLSGHIHLLDRVEYNGVTYICNGAVCGKWWHGNYHDCPPGYGLVDLYSDGTFDHQYVTYG